MVSQRITLIRHAEAQPAIADAPLASRRDAALSALGRWQAQCLSRPLATLGKTLVYASPLPRALETAKTAAQAAKLSFETDSALCEIDFGEWEGLTFEEMARRDPERIAAWGRFDPEFAFPGGERLGDFVARVQALGRRLRALDQPVTLITHGGVIRTLICVLLNLDPRHYLLFGADCASISQIDLFEAGGVLIRLNDTCHLDDS